MKVLSRAFAMIVLLAVVSSMGVFAGNPTRSAIAATQAATMSAAGTFPRTITDGAGNSLTIAAKPARIVSVSLGSDEILLSLVDPSRVVAVTANALDPAQSNVADAAKKIPNQLAKADPEAVLALKPDLVFISPFTDAAVIKQLKDAKLAVFLLNAPTSIKDIEGNITAIGAATGDETRAADMINTMESRLAAISAAVKNVKPLTVLYYAPDGYSDGPGTTIDEVITRAGGINAVAAGGIKDLFPQLSDEFVVKQDPDVILLAGFNSYAPGFVDKFNKNPNFQTLKAIKNKRVVVANDAHIGAVSQYIVEGVADVAALLYPDAYATIATSQATSATAAATQVATAAQK